MANRMRMFNSAGAAVAVLVLCVPTLANGAGELLCRIGIDAPSLAASGASAADVAAVLDAIGAAEEEVAALATATQASDAAAGAYGAALSSSSTDEETIAALRVQAESATVATRLASDDLWYVASAALPADVAQRLENCRAASEIPVPQALKVVVRSPESWLAIQAALRAERRALRCGESPSSAVQALLGGVRGEPEVAAALALEGANASTIEALLAPTQAAQVPPE